MVGAMDGDGVDLEGRDSEQVMVAPADRRQVDDLQPLAREPPRSRRPRSGRTGDPRLTSPSSQQSPAERRSPRPKAGSCATLGARPYLAGFSVKVAASGLRVSSLSRKASPSTNDGFAATSSGAVICHFCDRPDARKIKRRLIFSGISLDLDLPEVVGSQVDQLQLRMRPRCRARSAALGVCDRSASQRPTRPAKNKAISAVVPRFFMGGSRHGRIERSEISLATDETRIKIIQI